MLEENGLQFLAESEQHMMSVHVLPPEVKNFLEKFTDVVEREQYLDFFTVAFFDRRFAVGRKFGSNAIPRLRF
jgi:Predicted methyltransferase regulatory domain.